jgi:hypothetical protein
MLGKYTSEQAFHKVAARTKKACVILKKFSGVAAINLVQHYIHHHAGD